MTIQRAARPQTGYTIIRDDVLRDDRLSYRARGVLAAILSRPDNWTTTAERMVIKSGEGRDAIRTALKELETAGYIQRVKVQNDKGLWSTVTMVFDGVRTEAQPETDSQASVTDSQAPETGKPTTGKPTVGFSGPIKDNHQGQPKDPKPDPLARFPEFYENYPRHTARGDAEKAWVKAIKIAEPQSLIEAAAAFADRARGSDPKFIAHPATWLNGKRWLDEEDTPALVVSTQSEWRY